MLLRSNNESRMLLNRSGHSFSPLTDTPSIPIWFCQMHLSRPRLFRDLNPKLIGDRFDVVNIEVEKRIGFGVPAVLRQMQRIALPPQEQIERKA